MKKVTSSTINEAFDNEGLEAIECFYAMRNQLNDEARKTVIDIVERMAFKPCSDGQFMGSELACELMNKYAMDGGTLFSPAMKTADDIKEIIIYMLKAKNDNINHVHIGFAPADGPEDEDFFHADVKIGKGTLFAPSYLKISHVYAGSSYTSVTLVVEDIEMLILSHRLHVEMHTETI